MSLPVVHNPAQPIYCSDLMLRAKQRADVEKSGSAGIVSDSELIGLLNLYYRNLAQRVDQKAEYYRAAFINIVPVPPQQRYALPSDFARGPLGIGLVDVLGINYNTWTPLQHWDMVNQNIPGTGFMYFTNDMFTNMTYRIVGPNVEFRPVKSQVNVGLWYVPQVRKLVSPGDVLEDWVVPGWEEFIVVGAAMMIAAKEQRSIMLTEEIFAMVTADIDRFAPNRDTFQPERVQRAWWGNQWPFGMMGGYFGPGQGGL